MESNPGLKATNITILALTVWIGVGLSSTPAFAGESMTDAKPAVLNHPAPMLEEFVWSEQGILPALVRATGWCREPASQGPEFLDSSIG